ncbi:CIA30 family protein [Phormidesmis priestleyi ULC007]|uniref:CIA30 family protein n=1 Tax=Phormidesmis priestleyi ULC007 TaxID=1920490 RepID=A0A2T1DIR0_9CYAN|nr:CIA30 family protein [Phormidesmis priestleyi]PSB20353.1 CIA30 family protein [Phormidesmis priestleyi ULC007]PZO47057.1 MAG: CIA30 family protein [Phormidesmis priestleyi]
MAQWDAGRFVQTLAYFEVIPLVSWLQKMFQGDTPSQPINPQSDVLFDFSNPSGTINLWGALDDVVMGGVSASSFQQIDRAALFTGTVSTENSGGFASVRTRNFEPAVNLSGYEGIELRVKGDGNRYKFIARDDETWDSIAYTYSFDTVADEWLTVNIPFAELVPAFRAKTLKDANPIATQHLRSLQLMLSKFEYDGALNPKFTPGTFHLYVATIKAYRGSSV